MAPVAIVMIDLAVVALSLSMLQSIIVIIMFLSWPFPVISNMTVALYMQTLNLAMHPRGGRGQHNHPPFGSFWLCFVCYCYCYH